MRSAVAAVVTGIVVFWSSPGLAGSYTIANANLRTSPVESPSTVLVTLPRGAEVTVVGNQFVNGTRWFEVTAGGYSGWVRADLIHFVPAESPSEARPSPEVEAIGSSSPLPSAGHTLTAANLRRAPRIAENTYVRTLPPGSEVEILGREEVDGALWYRVATELGSGWVRSDLIEVHDRPAGETAGTEVPSARQPTISGEGTRIGEVAPAPIPRAEDTPTAAPIAQLAAANEAGAPPAAAVPDVPPTPAGNERLGAQRPAPADTGVMEEKVNFGVADARAALRPEPKGSRSDAPAWPVEVLRSGQIFFAALVLVVGLVHAARRLEQHFARGSGSESLSPLAYVDRALRNTGIREEYDRLLNALYAIERLLVASGSNRSAFAQLSDLVAAVNTSTDHGERIERLGAIKLKMLQAGVLPALTRAFGGLDGYAFTAQLREEIRAFLYTPDREIEERFERIREGTKAAFDELSRRLVPDLLHGAALTFLFSRRLDLLEVARATAASAASRGWTARDLDSVRQVIVLGLFQRLPLRGGR